MMENALDLKVNIYSATGVFYVMYICVVGFPGQHTKNY